MKSWLTDYCGEPLTPREEAIATAAGQKLADRTQQLLNDWAYLDDAEFAQKYQMKKTFLPHLYAEWLKGQGL